SNPWIVVELAAEGAKDPAVDHHCGSRIGRTSLSGKSRRRISITVIVQRILDHGRKDRTRRPLTKSRVAGRSVEGTVSSTAHEKCSAVSEQKRRSDLTAHRSINGDWHHVVV